MRLRWLSVVLAGVGLLTGCVEPEPTATPVPIRTPTLEPVPIPTFAQPGSVAAAVAVSAGSSHTCAVTASGGLKCWGKNEFGQLGDGTTTDRTTPGDVVGLTSGVAAVSARGGSSNQTCALTTAGGLKCWGNNQSGQLGDGTTTDRTTPVDVVGLTSGVAAVSGGTLHTCAVTTAGGLKCWGDNFFGQLGDGTTADRLAPVDVVGLTSSVAAVSNGNAHTCAVTSTGGVKCWGSNLLGPLGDGTTVDRLTPVDVVGLTSNAAAVAAGAAHTCALTKAGGLKCWGFNELGALGDGTTTDRAVPVDVSGLASGVTAVSAGRFHTCALTTVGLKCWGFNISGQLGDGTTTQRTAPGDVAGLTSAVAAAAAGGEHTCVLTTEGGLKCWGRNLPGQLGNGTTTDRTKPTNVVGFPGRQE